MSMRVITGSASSDSVSRLLLFSSVHEEGFCSDLALAHVPGSKTTTLLHRISNNLVHFTQQQPDLDQPHTATLWTHWTTAYSSVLAAAREVYQRITTPQRRVLFKMNNNNHVAGSRRHDHVISSTEELHYMASQVGTSAFLLHYWSRDFPLQNHPLVEFIIQQAKESFLTSTARSLPQLLQPLNHSYTSQSSQPSHLNPIQTPLHNSSTDSSFSLRSLYSPVSFLIPSSRGNSRDTVIFFFAFDWDDADHHEMISLALTFCHHLSTVPWNSRDVFVELADIKQPYGQAARDFLHDYFYDNQGWRHKKGIPRMAVILRPDPALHFEDLNVNPYGIDGRQANQDLVASFVHAATHEDLTTVPKYTIWSAFQVLAQNIALHELHSPFLQEDIPAITVGLSYKLLRSITKKNGYAFPSSALLSTSRGYSSLEESLHHSFNYYFFTPTFKQISSEFFFIIPLPLALLPAIYVSLKNKPTPHPFQCETLLQFGFFTFFVSFFSWSLATKNWLRGQWNPICSVTSPLDYSLYLVKVFVILLVSAFGFLLFVLLNYFFLALFPAKPIDPSASKNHQTQWSQTHLGVVTSSFLVILLIINWPLGVLSTLWFVPATVLFEPLYGVMGTFRHKCSWTRRFLCVCRCVLFLSWLGFTAFLFSPAFHFTTVHRRRFLLYVRSLMRHPSLLNSLGFLSDYLHPSLRDFLPYNFFHHLKLHGFLDAFPESTNLAHPLTLWPKNFLKNCGTPHESLSPFLFRIYPYMLWLNPSFVILVYETLRDAYCIHALYPFLIWFGTVPLFFYHLLLFFVPII